MQHLVLVRTRIVETSAREPSCCFACSSRVEFQEFRRCSAEMIIVLKELVILVHPSNET